MKKEDFLMLLDKIDFEKVSQFNITLITADQNNFNVNNTNTY